MLQLIDMPIALDMYKRIIGSYYKRTIISISNSLLYIFFSCEELKYTSMP